MKFIAVYTTGSKIIIDGNLSYYPQRPLISAGKFRPSSKWLTNKAIEVLAGVAVRKPGGWISSTYSTGVEHPWCQQEEQRVRTERKKGR